MKDMNVKDQKLEEILRHAAAEFIQRESSRTSLITVTGVHIFDKGSKATILITVLPETMQDDALDFTKRKRTELRDYIKAHTKVARIPFVDFAIDLGEKNRQRIDEISSNVMNHDNT